MVANSELAAGSEHPLKVIFIAGASHSGSTLLDLMLNAHPEIVSAGELKQLGRYARLQKGGREVTKRNKPKPEPSTAKCTCGAPTVWGCPFWSRVSGLTEGASGRTIADLNVEDYAEALSFATDNVVLFRAIATAAGKRHVVDSSKHRGRLKLLLQNPALDVFPVFLLRNPQGQICSSLKSLSPRENPRKKRPSLVQSILTYVQTNREIRRLLDGRPHAVVHYEELVHNPERTLRALMQQLGLGFHPGQLDWAAHERHNVGGNHARWRQTSELQLDERWREVLTLPQKIAIQLGTLPGRYS
jgi:Sulfotransferase family